METADAIRRLAASPDDRHAWEDAVLACQGLCWRIALRMLGPDAAPDAVQDVLLALRQAARRFRPGADAEAAAVAWIARIAVNTCHHHRRRAEHAGAPLTAAREPLASPAPAPDAELSAQLNAALAELPAEQCEVLTLRYFAGLDFAGVAAATGVREGAARMRVQRGLAALRSALGRRGLALGATALALQLDELSAGDVPPPPPASTAAWATTHLPPLATVATTLTGTLIMLASLTALGLTAALFTQAPAPAVAPPAPPAVAPAGPATLDDALRWLVAHQNPDGSWGVDGRDTVDVAREMLHAAAGGSYDASIRKAVAWVIVHPYVGDEVRRAAGETDLLYGMLWQTAFQPGAPGADVPPLDLTYERPAADALDRLLRLRPPALHGWPAQRGAAPADRMATAEAVLALKQVLFWVASSGVEPLGHASRELRDAIADSAAGLDGTYAAAPPAAPGITADDVAALLIAQAAFHASPRPWMRVLADRLATLEPTTLSPQLCALASSAGFDADCYQGMAQAFHQRAGQQLAAAIATGDLGTLACAVKSESIFQRWDLLFGSGKGKPIHFEFRTGDGLPAPKPGKS